MQELYNNLMALTKNEAFYFVDQFVESTKYRLFLYRLASYTEFCLPDALEARGITFELDANDQPKRIACRPFAKFFNLGENPMVMNLDIRNETVEYVMDKMDGSLISTYLHYSENGSVYLKLKTKGSLHSEQAQAAQALLLRPENAELRDVLEYLTMEGATVNLEYTAPENRIVLGYEKPELTILGARYIDSGNNVLLKTLRTFTSKIAADYTDEAKAVGVDAYLRDVTGKTGVEGVVVRLTDGTMVKIKADAYVALHHAKDSINTPRRLYEAVVNESADDLRSMFREDPVALMMIDEMQKKVSSLYNNMVATVEAFYQENKILGRKEYAILGQQVLDRKYFSLAMMKYLGKEVDYKGFLIKSWKEFGIKDDPVNMEEAA